MEQRLVDANATMKMIGEAKVKHETSRTFAENIIRFSKTVLTIPENPTNGDMIKALFPDIDFRRGDFFVIPFKRTSSGRLVETDDCRDFEIRWWDAPYKNTKEK